MSLTLKPFTLHSCFIYNYSFITGAVIYLVQSNNYDNRLVANNSLLIHNDPDDCSSDACFTDIYCYSNSTSSHTTGTVILPDGNSYNHSGYVMNTKLEFL